MKNLTEVEKRVYEIGHRDNEDRDTIIGAVLAISYDGIESEVTQYLDQHPDATLQELLEFMEQFAAPIEIVDD